MVTLDVADVKFGVSGISRVQKHFGCDRGVGRVSMRSGDKGCIDKKVSMTMNFTA